MAIFGYVRYVSLHWLVGRGESDFEQLSNGQSDRNFPRLRTPSEPPDFASQKADLASPSPAELEEWAWALEPLGAGGVDGETDGLGAKGARGSYRCHFPDESHGMFEMH